MTRSHIRPISELKEALMQDLEIRLEGNQELLKATERFFPNNKQDIETLKQYSQMITDAIKAIEGGKND